MDMKDHIQIISSIVVIGAAIVPAIVAILQLKADNKRRENTHKNNFKYHNSISAGSYHTVYLKLDGTVSAVGANIGGQCNTSNWYDIIAISAGGDHTIGLKSDGTVVAVGENAKGQCDVHGWQGIVAISAGGDHTVGLKSDGAVVAVGANYKGQCDVHGWQGIVAVSAGDDHTVGLKSDGTVVTVGENEKYAFNWLSVVLFHLFKKIPKMKYCGKCDVSNWQNLVAVSAGGDHTIGLKSNGIIVATGDNECGQCNISWRNFKYEAKKRIAVILSCVIQPFILILWLNFWIGKTLTLWLFAIFLLGLVGLFVFEIYIVKVTTLKIPSKIFFIMYIIIWLLCIFYSQFFHGDDIFLIPLPNLDLYFPCFSNSITITRA